LDEVLLRLSNTLEKQVEIRRKMKSAMTYPVAVLVLVILILTAMMIFVIPTFKKIFASLHGQLPLPTRILMAVSHIFVAYLPLVILFYIGATIGFIRFRRSKRGREILDRLVLKIPIFGKLAHKYAVVRFSRTLASLLRSGVPILNSLSITAEAAGNVKMVEAVSDIGTGVKQGEPLARRMALHSIFPPMVTQMVSVGEETGGVDDMLDKVASFYESEVEAMVASLSSLLEPVLIVVLGSVVGSMVISLYLPMFNVYKLIN
jgi:type IV pilus assembly protein PilC